MKPMSKMKIRQRLGQNKHCESKARNLWLLHKKLKNQLIEKDEKLLKFHSRLKKLS